VTYNIHHFRQSDSAAISTF